MYKPGVYQFSFNQSIVSFEMKIM